MKVGLTTYLFYLYDMTNLWEYLTDFMNIKREKIKTKYEYENDRFELKRSSINNERKEC